MSDRTFKKNTITVESLRSEINIPNSEFRFDENSGKIYNTAITVAGQAYNIYPWGVNNMLPNEMISLLKSNGDIGNLIDARVDFLFGTGITLFERTITPKETIFTPVQNSIVDEYFLEQEINNYIDQSGTHLVETGTAFINVSRPTGSTLSKLIAIDPLNVRVDRLKKGEFKKSRFVVSADWTVVRKNAAMFPAYDFQKGDKNPANCIIQLMKPQTGQFYYGYPRWWAAAEWIKLSNKIALFHNKSLESDNNVAYVCTVAEQYFTDIFNRNNIFDENEQAAYRDKFHEDMKQVICVNDGTNHVIFDEGFINESGDLKGYISFTPIKRSFTGNEFAAIHQLCVNSVANAAGILTSLAGVVDGKVVGGSGSELRVSAEYQQFYRTPRERALQLEPLNRILLPELKSHVLTGKNKDYVFGYQNILMETLDKSKSGNQTADSVGGSQKPTSNKTDNA